MRSMSQFIDDICENRTIRNISMVLIKVSVISFVIVELLPIVRSVNPIIVSVIKIIIAILFFIAVLFSKPRLFIIFVLLTILEVAYNVYMFYQVWDVLEQSFFSILISSSTCWLFIFMGMYLTQWENDKFKRIVEIVCMIVIAITSITTIIGVHFYPEASRRLGNADLPLTLKTTYYLMNIASWGLVYGMTISLVYWLYSFITKKKVYYLLLSVLITICVFKTQISFAVIFAFIVWFVLLIYYFVRFGKTRIIRIVIGTSIVFGVFMLSIIGYMFRFELLLSFAEFLQKAGNNTIAERVYGIYLYFCKGTFQGDGGIRMELYIDSIDTFLENPLLGHHMDVSETASRSTLKIGMHSTILDSFAATGIVGGLCVVATFIYSCYYCVRNIIREYRFALILSIIVLILFNLINPTIGAEQAYFAAFVIPVLLGRKDIEGK